LDGSTTTKYKRESAKNLAPQRQWQTDPAHDDGVASELCAGCVRSSKPTNAPPVEPKTPWTYVANWEPNALPLPLEAPTPSPPTHDTTKTIGGDKVEQTARQDALQILLQQDVKASQLYVSENAANEASTKQAALLQKSRGNQNFSEQRWELC
jgi:hypothetical protein